MEVQIKELTENVSSNNCYVSYDIFNVLELSEDTLYKIHLGQSYEYSCVKPKGRFDKCMYFSNPVFKKLLLFQDITLNIWRNKDEIYLGPVVGILINPRGIEAIRNGEPPFGIQKHAEAGSAANCLAYHYSIEDINWNEGKIKGYIFVRSLNKWICDWFPIPDVLYDNAGQISIYEQPFAEYMKQQFRAKDVHFINNNKRYLGKWLVYECLSKYPDIRIHLPKTIIYKGFNDVLSMLSEFGFIFVKASGGTHGTSVLSIEHIGKEYKLNFYKEGLKEVIFNDIEDVKMFVEKYAKRRPFIVQQGIRLVKYNGRNMDLRLLMIKDGQGKWEALTHHCRVAQKNFTITNCFLGGEWVDYEKVYPNLSSPFSKKIIPDKNEIVNTTKKVLYYYEKEFGSFGEVGMDMAVDIYGDIWFIEANTKPEKLTVPSLYDPGEIPPQAINIFEYAKFLKVNAVPGI